MTRSLSRTRTCIGCRSAGPQDELVRFAAVEGRVVPDLDRRLPGRGAWLHPRRACLEHAMDRRAFDRAFRAGVHTPADLIDCTGEWQRSASTS